MSIKAAEPVVNRLRERVMGVLETDPKSAIRLLCDEIDWMKQELSELKIRKGRTKTSPEVSIVSTKDIDQCVTIYTKLFTDRYGFRPGKTQRLRRECQSFCGILKEDACRVIEHYLQDSDSAVVAAKHSMTDLLARAEVFHSEWKATRSV